MTMTQPDVVRLRSYLTEVEHDLCIALVVAPENGEYAYVVCETESGDIVAWDGWYDDADREADVVPLSDLEWDEWDDMPTKFLIRRQSRWATARMAYFLIPTFSPARAAGRMVRSTQGQDTSDLAAGHMSRARVVAYLPVHDRDVFEAARSGNIVG